MPRQSKIAKYGLERMVFELRKDGFFPKAIAELCNAELEDRGVADSVTSKAVERHFRALDGASAPEVHAPRAVEANATLAVSVADRLGLLDEHVSRWIVEADRAVKPMHGVVYDVNTEQIVSDRFAPEGEEPDENACVPVFVADWHARGTAARELREATKAVADILARVHDVEQVQAFQQSVMEAIGEASPEVAHKVLEKMREKQSIRRAHLLGGG